MLTRWETDRRDNYGSDPKLDYGSDPKLAGNDLVHLLEEYLAPRLLPLPGVLGIPETHLAHRVPRLSVSEYLTTNNATCSDFP